MSKTPQTVLALCLLLPLCGPGYAQPAFQVADNLICEIDPQTLMKELCLVSPDGKRGVRDAGRRESRHGNRRSKGKRVRGPR